MIIESIRVTNFRSILAEMLLCDDLTALVGVNGAGKSSFLRALEIFYSPTPKIDMGDYYNKDVTRDITVAVTFKNLSDEAQEKFSKYMQGDTLTVERVFSWDSGKTTAKYHGSILMNPEFQGVREGLQIKDRGVTAKEAYNALRNKPEYSTLPAWTTLAVVETTLRTWEGFNLAKCNRQRDDGQFFGFRGVGQGYLGKFTKFLFIPAVRNASDDAAEGRGSVLTGLMDLVVRSIIANKDTVKNLKEETQKKYEELMDPTKLTELSTLSVNMTKTLQTFVPDAEVDLKWLPLQEISIPMPQADIRLVEDGYSSDVARTGHGLQRAFILTMLQHLVLAQTATEHMQKTTDGDDWGEKPAFKPSLPNLVLGIEEPELYQHPSRQRYFADILLKLASGMTPGVAEKTQVIYGTHSPLFVGIDRINQVRLLRKVDNSGMPKITKIISTSLDSVAKKIWEADGCVGPKYTGKTLQPRLQAIMTPWMNEGFFANVVVLVEGEDDRAAILGIAQSKGHIFESMGVAVIPCGGKTNIDRPATIFHELGIPVYVIWDGDKGGKNANPEDNKRLLRLMNARVEEWPFTLVGGHYTCFEIDLESILQEEVGNVLFEELLKECQDDLCIPKRKHALKNPHIVAKIIKLAREKRRTSNTLENVVDRIVAKIVAPTA
ncbi:ATP-dependent nuclease [Anaeroselena agilis]|uniref:ATP-dependent endonuclease n=1 Tax=Anaeroselena agilis TaxID=3063788 RepID=A0ABU3NWR6_9FIRM|nr:ATP-dependent endonuclease [Selenomonadales bacterium 4137-cl]